MIYEFHTFNKNEAWATEWHMLCLTKDEADRVFIEANSAARGKTRNGGKWQAASHESYQYLRREVDEWVRSEAGPPEGETWECDRFYHPDETPPELPAGGGRGAWLERFICYPEKYGSYYHHRWAAGKVLRTDMPGIRAMVRFRDKETAALFAALFL